MRGSAVTIIDGIGRRQAEVPAIDGRIDLGISRTVCELGQAPAMGIARFHGLVGHIHRIVEGIFIPARKPGQLDIEERNDLQCVGHLRDTAIGSGIAARTPALVGNRRTACAASLMDARWFCD